jgi:hypothetical protein
MKEINKRNYFLTDCHKSFHLMLDEFSISCLRLSHIVKDIHQIILLLNFIL